MSPATGVALAPGIAGAAALPDPAGQVPVLTWGVALLLVAAVLLAVLSALLERSGPIRLRHWAEEAGGRLRTLYDQPARFGSFRYLLSICGRLAPLGLYMALDQLLADLKAAHPAAWSLAVTFLLLVAIEMCNRALVGRHPERALRNLTRLYRGVLLAFTPLVALMSPLVPVRNRARREEDDESEASDEEIEAFIDVGTREGILEPEQGEWVSNIVEFGGTQARSVMTPRIDMVCAPVAASLDELAGRFISSGHSRIPLFEDSIDHITGILNLHDVVRALRGASSAPARELAKPPFFIPETKPVGELLKEFQARFQQLAIVVDEYGGTAGLVTVEDLLEEIVGEISDEHHAQALVREPLPDGAWRLDGRTRVETLDELFGVEIEEPEYETVAGLIFSALGHVPHAGETVDQEGLRFVVEAVSGRRIQTVRVGRIPAAAEAAAGEERAE